MDEIARAVYGIPQHNADAPDNGLQLLARSDGISLQVADTWRTNAPLKPIAPDERATGVFTTGNLDFIATRARYAFGDEERPIYTYIRIPRAHLRSLSGNIRPVLMDPPDEDGTLPGMRHIKEALANPWTASARLQAFNRLLALCESNMTALLSLLNAALSQRRLLILEHPGTNDDRLDVVQGLMTLLPDTVRADLTFSTYTPGVTDLTQARVVFGEARRSTRHVITWNNRTAGLDDVTWLPYVELLLGFWQGDANAFLAMIDALNPLAAALPTEKDTIAALPDLTARYVFNVRVTSLAEETPAEELKYALRESDRIPAAWQRQYASLLLPHALEDRDTEADSLIAHLMDSDDELDDELQAQMNAMLHDTPDLVYVFMRQRLSEGEDARWLRRLQNAAQHSLDVALDSGDTELITSWLRLIAREPAQFKLEDMLRDGIFAAVPMAHQDGQFALALLVLAARFAAPVLDELLRDDDLINVLPEPLPAAFRDHDRDALADLQSHSTSLYLAGLYHAAHTQSTGAFESATIERLWALHEGDQKYNHSAHFTPDATLQICVETGAAWLPPAALETLLKFVLADRNDRLFATFTTQLAEQGTLGVHLSGALIRIGANVGNALDTTAMLVSSNKLKPEAALTVYVTLLNEWGWDAQTHSIMESTARLLMQNNDLSLPVATLNTMLSAAAALHDESIARAAALKLMDALVPEEDAVFAEEVQRVFSMLAWSSTARDALLKWWREFVQQQPTARLTRIDAELTGKRVTEDALQTLRSVVALRRLIGKRDVEAFARDVNTAYDVLETLAEAFDPGDRANGNGANFDPETVRTVLAQMSEDLSPHQRQILSNSLKGLAMLVARMGDNRSKAGIGRTADNLDRQLLTGETTPQSAVDAMKWISGVFSGAN
ncbi:MAG: hypothetical protein AAFR56_06260, partial [Chloroflexota bacterium]